MSWIIFIKYFQDTTVAVATPEAHPDKSGGTGMSRGSYIDTSALSMSKDSLEEGYSMKYI